MVSYCLKIMFEEEVAEYFQQMLSVEDGRKTNMSVLGDKRMPVLKELNERTITKRKIRRR